MNWQKIKKKEKKKLIRTEKTNNTSKYVTKVKYFKHFIFITEDGSNSDLRSRAITTD